jgi:hypothetical protein
MVASSVIAQQSFVGILTEEIGIIRCAPVMYLKARRRANKRYQNTYQGHINHAARQKRYTERLKQKLTHQGSKALSVGD